eukprot:3275898-Prymnesium_polylepis.1
MNTTKLHAGRVNRLPSTGLAVDRGVHRLLFDGEDGHVQQADGQEEESAERHCGAAGAGQARGAGQAGGGGQARGGGRR